ncbi:MAG: PsbP-related protein [Bacteroidota bacterium]
MIKKVLFFSLLAIAVVSFSCDFFGDKNLSLEEDFKEVKVDNEFAVYVPDYMSETKELNHKASLQYANLMKEVYVTVIREDKSEVEVLYDILNVRDDTTSALDSYTELREQMFSTNLKEFNLISTKETKINGREAVQMEFTGKVKGVNRTIWYLVTLVEGNEIVYMLMTWTLQNRKEKYREAFEMTARSFRLL